ncbi:MAG: ADP-ribosylglycohydrolase family protein [Azoarcus sp.]|jgi:type I restriction enzyme M protein|nr:ADP-ribosylglycohydrolase family protein [Azoarcus sp.]
MLGAIIGDIVGSRFEFDNCRSKDFELFARNCRVTDDSIMTLAIASAIMSAGTEDGEKLAAATVAAMQKLGRQYPFCGFGAHFARWVNSTHPAPYNSYGNGAAMRVSPAAIVARTLEEAIRLARIVTGVTHNHPEGLKGAEATATAIFMARSGASKNDIRDAVGRHYYPLDFTIDAIRPGYTFNETCQKTVPQAIEAFLESDSFEDAIRIAISLGGDSDTLAAIAGSIAEAFYGISDDLAKTALRYLDANLHTMYDVWNAFLANARSAPYKTVQQLGMQHSPSSHIPGK